jgi:tetratricopeptide (TPR) repeat protein
MTRWNILWVFLLLSSLAFGQEELVQFEQANKLYRDGEFAKAAQLYERIIVNGEESPALFYNLGNCYFKTQNIPSAILAYERAKRLAPHDDDIAYNLRLANLRVVDKIEPVPQIFFIEWWISLLNMFSSDGWAVTAIAALWAAAIGGAVFLRIRWTLIQRVSVLVTFFSILICALSVGAMFRQMNQERNEHSAIVFSPTVSVKSAPDNQSTDLFVIHEGVKVELLDALSDWRKIRLADGKVGWMQLESLQII